MDFYPVILGAGKGSRMYPLTEECPKALLSVGNMPLIWYPIQLLEKNGFKEALVVVRDSQRQLISDALEGLQAHHGVRMKFTLCDIPDQEDWGTADSLRCIRTKIKGDVLLMSCDLVTSFPLHSLTLFHHAHHSTLTALLLRPPQPEDDSLRRKTFGLTSERDLVGIAEDSRIVLFSSQADLEDSLQLSRSMLSQYPHIEVCSELVDAHLYLIKRWVLDYLGESKNISSIKGELIPHLVRHQRQSSRHPVRQAMQSCYKPYIDELEDKSYRMSSHARSEQWEHEIVRCHALVVEDHICARVNTIQSFQEVNRLVTHNLSEFESYSSDGGVVSAVRRKGVSGDCLVSNEGVVLGDKVSIKRSCISKHCIIGDKTKILNCVVMDHVQIGDGCVLQGCILSSHARIEDRVNLKECQVGTNFTVTREADLKGEALVVGGGMDF